MFGREGGVSSSAPSKLVRRAYSLGFITVRGYVRGCRSCAGRFTLFPERKVGVECWSNLLKGRRAAMDKVVKPLQATAAGMSAEEHALVQKLCFGCVSCLACPDRCAPRAAWASFLTL